MISEKDRPKLEYWNFPGEDAAREVYSTFLVRLKRIYDDIHFDQAKPVLLDQFIDDLVPQLEEKKWDFFRVFADGQVFRRSLSAAAFNAALCLWYFGLQNGWDKPRVRTGMRGALLHEVGMLFIPQEILSKKGRVEDKERAIIESHPTITSELTVKWMEAPEIQAMALQHHEEWSGTGYPQGLKEDQIHPMAQLLGLVQSFVAMATERDYRNSMVGYLAMKQILGLQGTRFARNLVLSFVNSLGLHPPGSVVLLSDGSISRVLEPVYGNPLRPKVRILIDSAGTEYRQDNGAILELEKASKILIARPVNLLDIQESEQ